MNNSPSTQTFPFRAAFIGLILAIILNTVFPYGMLVLGTIQWTGDFIAPGAILSFFILILFNTPLKWLKSKWALSPQELVVIYTMMLAAAVIPSTGVTSQLVPFLAGISYYATTENNWTEVLHPFIKSWLIPQDAQAIKYFYEGLPQGAPIPWNAWMVPLLAWASFMVALYLMLIALSALLHRQWAHHERLVYPLVQLPLEMIQQDHRNRALNPFLKSPLMWLGFAVPFLLLGVNGLHKYFEFIPPIQLSTSLSLSPEIGNLHLSFWFIVIGLTYFLSLEISFSLWFFYLLHFFEVALYNTVGYSITETRLMHTEGTIATAQQAIGAMIALVAVGFWTARGHLKRAVQIACKRAAPTTDENQMLSYRSALLILAGATSYALLWLYRAGLPLAVSVVLLLIAFVVYIGLTRIVAEGGMGYGRTQMTPPAFTIAAFGTTPIGPAGLAVLGLCNGWAGDIRVTLMAAANHSQKLADLIPTRKKHLFWAILLAISAGLIASAWTVISIAYWHGGINLHYWFYRIMGNWTFSDMVAVQLTPIPSGNFWGPRGFFTGLGAAIMCLLMYLRHHFLWFPIHPIGLPVGGTYVMFFAWSSMALSWSLKWMILKYGGTRLYRTLKPFFLGLVLGQVSSAGFWLALDLISGYQMNIGRW